MQHIPPITICIVDDHPLARQGIHTILNNIPDFSVIGEAESADDAQKLIAELQPKVLLLDMRMPGKVTAAQLERWVRANYPQIVTIVLTAHDRDAYLSTMLNEGIAGYINKNVRSEHLIQAIRRASQGEKLFDETQIKRARNWRVNI